MAKILICEDDALYRQVAQLAFEGSEHEIHFASNSLSVSENLKREAYDMLITDLVMPDKDGLEIIREVRNSGSALPILAMSAGVENLKAPLLTAAAAFGANGAIQKPFRPQKLRECAEALLSSNSQPLGHLVQN